MHSFLKKTLSLSLALSLLAGAAGATTLTGLETETVERNWESSLFFPRMEALTGVSMDAHAVSDETQYADLIAAMAQGSIPADVLFKANLSRAQERIEETMDALIKGFDKQLDDLYRNEAMDIDSDIRVMENMLRRDTASVEDDFGLGGAAVQRAPDEE